MPTPASSDSEDCSLGEGPDFPKDTEMRVNKINTTSTQKVDELESDSSDLELTIDEVDDGKEEGMSKITVKWKMISMQFVQVRSQNRSVPSRGGRYGKNIISILIF